MSLVGAEGTLDGLGTVVTAELPRHIDRLLGKDFEDLCAVRSVVGVGKPRVSCLLSLWVYRNVALLAIRNVRRVHTHTFEVHDKKNNTIWTA